MLTTLLEIEKRDIEREEKRIKLEMELEEKRRLNEQQHEERILTILMNCLQPLIRGHMSTSNKNNENND